MIKLKFGRGNAKLGKQVYTFSLPAGKSCPGALDCKSEAVMGKDGKTTIKDGPHCQYRCFAASHEAKYPGTYNARKHNFILLRGAKTTGAMAALIQASLPKRAKYVRIHVSGDFFNANYLKAWVKVAADNPGTLFYAYTKSAHLFECQWTPKNLEITFSEGGRYDHLIPLGARKADVITDLDLLVRPVDHDDSHAMGKHGNGDFSLLLHGTQPKGRTRAIHGYSGK